MKLFLVLFFLLFTPNAYAGRVEIGRAPDNKPIVITYNDKYSFKDYTGRTLLKATDLNNTIVYASCFSQEIPDRHIFPDAMTGVTFVNCNLDNVYIPAGNTVIGGSQKRFKVQNDLRDWEIDINNRPVEVMGKEYWQSQGYSVDPKDIPRIKLKDIEGIKRIR